MIAYHGSLRQLPASSFALSAEMMRLDFVSIDAMFQNAYWSHIYISFALLFFTSLLFELWDLKSNLQWW